MLKKTPYKKSPYKKSLAVFLVTTSMLTSSLATATTFEAEVNLLQSYSGGFGGLGPGVRGGVSLGRQIVLLTGLDLGLTGGHSKSSTGDNEYSNFAVEIPLELKVYLRQPSANRVVPVLRLGVGYGYNRWSTNEDPVDVTHWFTGKASVGLQYFFSEHIAVSASMGMAYRKVIDNYVVYNSEEGGPAENIDYDHWTLAAEGRLGLILRI